MLDEYEISVTGTDTDIAPRKKVQIKKSGSDAPWYYLGLIGEIGFAIAVPIAGGAILGVVIDKAWGTTPKATLSLLFLGVVISFINLFKTVETVTKQP
ncbi:MAG: AtpZ/AtpI family protein [Candidatus Gottesmanbacteria bacterium]|nr:AtpZ/AtpI family protein [Candidatus Gottesmanbacteria bacterium]